MPADDRFRALAKVGTKLVFEETIRIFPMTKGGGADPSRDQVPVSARFRSGAEDARSQSGGQVASSWQSRISASEALAYITRAQYPDLVVRQGDKVRRVDRAGMHWYRVSAVNDRGAGDIILHLSES